MSELDKSIEAVLASLQAPEREGTFDHAAYIAAFQQSAQEKARSVLELLSDPKYHVSDLVPVFISVGGGDGEELDYLLRNSHASLGILVEYVRPLAEVARRRSTALPDKKRIEVIEGDAQERIGDAITFAHEAVVASEAQVVVVTCHAVLHELYDRGRHGFDPLGFFGTIFRHRNIATLFTYREPGIPKDWPEVVLLKANCSPESILALAGAITQRHVCLAALDPKPLIAGDHVRLHRTLAIEVLSKAFYLSDLRHEIEERSSSIDHGVLTNFLWTAIGDTARIEHRANIVSFSAPSSSFVRFWERHGVDIRATKDDGSTSQLAIAESHTRVVAWRLGSTTPREGNVEQRQPATPTPPTTRPDLITATQAFDGGDWELLSKLLLSRGRAWIESNDKAGALHLLSRIVQAGEHDAFSFFWSHYLISIDALFAGSPSPDLFSESMEADAQRAGLGVLYRAERMEFLRKAGRVDESVAVANSLAPLLAATPADACTSLQSYIAGTVLFLVANLLRSGGRYDTAWELLGRAEQILRAGIESHETELAHCYYAKSVCIAMAGVSDFDVRRDLPLDMHQFAGALIQLSYAHSSWFIGDLARATVHAEEAAAAFHAIGADRYAKRAKQIAGLLRSWLAITRGEPLTFDGVDPNVARAVAAMTGRDPEFGWLSEWLPSLRLSTVLGLLQFAKRSPELWQRPVRTRVPRTLEVTENGDWRWSEQTEVGSLAEMDAVLRSVLGIPRDRKVPLIAD